MELETQFPESLKVTDGNKIFPIIGSHLDGSDALKNYDKFYREFDPVNDPEFSIWSAETVREVRKRSPRMVLIDGMTFDPLVDIPPFVWNAARRIFFPGNPYAVREDRKKFCITEGDLPISTLLDFKFSKKALSSDSTPVDLMHQALINFMEIPADWDIERLGGLATRTNADLRNLAVLYAAELIGSFGLALAGWSHLLKNSQQVSRRSFLKSASLKAVGIVAGLNQLRLLGALPSLFEDVPKGVHLYKPFELPLSSLYFFNPAALSARIKINSFRNVMSAIKLREADNLMPESYKSNGSLTVVFGIAHAFDFNIWDSPGEQEKRLRNNLEEIFGTAFNLAQENKIALNPEFKKAAIERLVQFLGGTLVWEVNLSDSNEAVSRRELLLAKNRKTITARASFISQTIKDLVNEAAQKTNF